jgi:thymidine kinase
MSLELLIGPMFAGKTSAVQAIVRRNLILGWKVFVVTHSMDTRYSDSPAIVNHDKQSMAAYGAHELLPLLKHADYSAAKLVVVEEAQFFPDLVEFIKTVVDNDGKHCVVVGLDGDAERRPFGRVLDLIPYCDRVRKLTAMCKKCGDGTPALFTHAVSADASAAAEAGAPCVGGEERYIPLCRRHYNMAKGGNVVNTTVEASMIGRV